MKQFLQPNECLVCDGLTACRAPDGTLLPAVQQYIIVKAGEADQATVEDLQPNERLVLAGMRISGAERLTAEQRYAAAVAGKREQSKRDGTPFYIKEEVEQVGEASGLSEGEEKTCDRIVGEMVEMFAATTRKMKALARQSGRK